MAKILHKVGEYVIESVLETRLVCKAWRDACLDYTGPANIAVDTGKHLPDVCSILAGLTDLTLFEMAAAAFLQPLSALQLRSLTLRQVNPAKEEGQLLDLTILPPSLRSLNVEDFDVNTDSFRNIHFGGLTSLTFFWTSNGASDIADLLQYLPQLLVSFKRQ